MKSCLLYVYPDLIASCMYYAPKECTLTNYVVESTLVWPVPVAQVLSRPQLIFPSKTWFLGIYLNFQRKKSLKKSISPTF